MPTPLDFTLEETQQYICDRALQMIGAAATTDVTQDTTTEAIWCRYNYFPLQNEVFSRRCWRFARVRQQIATTGPDAWGIDHVFPVDRSVVFGVWHVWDNPRRTGNLVWERVGDNIVAQTSGDIYIEGVQKKTELEWPPLFTRCYEARLAAGAALGVARSRALYTEMMNLHLSLLQEASAIDAREASTQVLDSSTLIEPRYSGGYGMG